MYKIVKHERFSVPNVLTVYFSHTVQKNDAHALVYTRNGKMKNPIPVMFLVHF